MNRCSRLKNTLRRSALILAIMAACTFSGTAALYADAYSAGPDQGRTCSGPIILADLVEGKDKVIYRTDPEADEAFEEDQRRERRKEEKSWQMLQNMNIYKESGSKPSQPKSSGKTGQ
ncbi:MAG: hypothetical protein LLG06_14940 [Desulfobacteraceae bacterium]|nr:hypothetical protein [Desulfobacteraceae bacterium]